MIEKLEVTLWELFGKKLKLNPKKATMIMLLVAAIGRLINKWVEYKLKGEIGRYPYLFINGFTISLCIFPLLLAFWFLAYICKKYKTIKFWHWIVFIFAVIYLLLLVMNIIAAFTVNA